MFEHQFCELGSVNENDSRLRQDRGELAGAVRETTRSYEYSASCTLSVNGSHE